MRCFAIAALLLALPSSAAAQSALLTDGFATSLVMDGSVVGTRAGVFVPTSHGLVALRLGSVAQPLYDCEASTPSPIGTAEVATLDAIADDGSVTPIFEALGELGRVHESSVRVEAIVGPYVFALRDTFDDQCGAHGNTERAFVLFDLEAGTSVAMDDPRLVRWARPLHARARSLYEGWDGWDMDDLDEQLAAVIPRLDRTPLPSVDTVFIAFTCYACSDAADDSVHEWASYYSAAHVPAAAPPFLASALRATAAARARWMGAIVGASALTANDAARLATAWPRE